jgi:LysM repeat protein
MRRILSLSSLVLFLAGVLLFTAPVMPVRAQASSAQELIAAVNALRSSNGLAPYQTDGSLMASAQSHSDYQASIQDTTHTRADGTSPADYSFIENIAGGLNLSASAAVNSFWQDELHLSTLTGLSEGYVGAGVAVDSSNVVYYTLQVRRAPGAVNVPVNVAPPAQGGSPASGAQDAADAPVVLLQQVTNTPQPDGSIIHVVQEGESAWTVADAYGLTVSELSALNGLSPEPALFPGQTLIVRQAASPTVTPTVTSTLRPPTRTPAPTRTPRPPTAVPSITPTASATPFSLLNALPTLEGSSRRSLGIGLIVVSGLGLLAMLGTSLFKRGR